ncbi:MAG: peptide deformylase [Anaerolineales bacterium]|nr:peptide deformylase [Anaerolineales bacterium]
MDILKIITPENPTLRQKAAPVERVRDMALQQLIDQMIATMRSVNGAGLAAPQVDQSLRMAVIETPAEIDEEGEEIPNSRKLYTIINPEITWASRKMVKGVEGCLSIPGYVGEVSRHQAIHVIGLDRSGKKLNLRLKGWDARIFQHEIDHLDGVLYTDRLTAPENFWTEEEFEELLKQEEVEAAD